MKPRAQGSLLGIKHGNKAEASLLPQTLCLTPTCILPGEWLWSSSFQLGKGTLQPQANLELVKLLFISLQSQLFSLTPANISSVVTPMRLIPINWLASARRIKSGFMQAQEGGRWKRCSVIKWGLREPGQAAPPGGINHEAAKGAGEKRGWIFLPHSQP